MSRSIAIQTTFGCMLIVVLIRACVLYEPLPGWDGNPITTTSAIIGIGPAGYLTLDAAAMLFAAFLCLIAGKRLGWIALLSLIGGAAVLAHTLLFAARDVEPLPVAGAWASGAAMLAGGSVAASRPALRRVGVAVILGFLCILLAKGVGQLLLEHPSVLDSFEQDPAAALAARGYEPGSASALQFERRLRQPDITAWFGLSNVLAAYLAAGAVGCLALCWQSRAVARSWPWCAVAVLGVLCWGGVFTAGSKAGLAIAGAGSSVFFAVLIVMRALGRTGKGLKIAGLLGLGLWILPVAAIAARAFLPHEGELSLLFRYFYLDTAVDIARHSMPTGTGIDSFRAAYATAKPPIAPESVTSSHNAITDWLAMLGIFGLPLALVVTLAAWQCAGHMRSQRCLVTLATPVRSTVLCIGLLLAIPVAFSATVESAATLLELSLLRLVGLLLAVAVAVAVWRLRPSRVVPTTFALVMLTHAQLDMLLFHPGSIPLAMFVIGLALPAKESIHRMRWACLMPAACAVVLIGLCARTWQWEASLRRAFDAAQQIALTTERAERGNAAAQAELPLVVREWSLVIRAELQATAAAMPDDPRVWLALCEVELMLAGPGDAAWEAAAAASEAEHSTRTLSRLSSVARAIASRSSAPEDRARWIELAREALVQAAELDPHGPHFPALIAELEAAEGREAPASAWAARALQSDANYALDPLAGLPDDRRRRIEDLMKVAPPGS